MHSGKEVQKRKIPIAKFEFCDEFMRRRWDWRVEVDGEGRGGKG